MEVLKIKEIVLRITIADIELTKSKTYDEVIDNFNNLKKIHIIEQKLVFTANVFKDYYIKFYSFGS